MPIISIVVPVYNVDYCLCRCIDSILQQTFRDFELILVDDGSTDNSGKICDDYFGKDTRIRVFHQENSGVSRARNNGVKTAVGRYITFIDSDDFVSHYYLEILYHACVESNASIACCSFIKVTDDNVSVKIKNNRNVMSSREAIEYFAGESVNNRSMVFVSPCSKLIKKELLEKVPFPTDRSYAEDAACVYLWLWYANRVVYIDDDLYFYYQNPESVCHQKIGLHIYGSFLTMNETLKFFKDNSFDELYMLFSRNYLEKSVWALNGAVRADDVAAEKLFKKCLRQGLRKYGKSTGYKNGELNYYYEKAYPGLMKMYWRLYGLKNHFKRK